ncbi:MAG: FecR family protein [Bacteroidetes bacterium]|jgi:transmembrane sensor|nr:FecR family protein [Bacteroidota bacterium]
MIEQFNKLVSKHLKEGLSQKEKEELLFILFMDLESQRNLALQIDDNLKDDNLPIEVDEKIGDKMLLFLESKIQQNNTNKNEKKSSKVISIGFKRKNIYRLIGLVASFFIVLYLFPWKDKNEKQIIAKNIESNHLLLNEHLEINKTGYNKKIQLPDSSYVILANNSQLSYHEPFRNTRSIYLTGRAFFKVFKDKTRPFTVFSREISTTALGTEFTVIAFKDNSNVIVRLHEGKVVVRPVGKNDRKMEKEVYLLAGDEFVYGENIVAKNNKIKKNIAPKQLLSEDNSLDEPSLPENELSSWYMFNNQSLISVIDQLSALYNVPIAYSKKDIQNIYFTGKYERIKSLDVIINRIATINKLKIIKKDSTYILIK